MRSYKENSKNNNKSFKINEALQNDITWGDSWAGRLIASVFRMAKLGVDLVAIKGLEAQLERAITNDIVTKLKEEDSDFKQVTSDVEDLAIRETLINCIKKDPSKLEKTLNTLKDKYGEERIQRIFENLPQEIKDILLALSNYSGDTQVQNQPKEVSKTIYIDMINNLKALNNILEYYDKIEIVDVLKKNDRGNDVIKNNNDINKNAIDTNQKVKPIKPGKGINKNSSKDKSNNGDKNNNSDDSEMQLTEILKYSDFLLNERNMDTNKPLFSIRSNETHLIQAYNGLKATVKGVISNDKGLAVDSKLISDLINNSKDSDVKNNIKDMYKQVCLFLSSGTVNANQLYKENYTDINNKSKRSIMADKIARLAKKTSQFQKENLYGGLGNSLGNALKNFNISMNNIVKFFKEEKENLTTNENLITDWINGKELNKNSKGLENTVSNNKVEVSVEDNKVTIIYNNEVVNKDELIEQSNKESIDEIQQKVNNLDVEDKVKEYIKVANIDFLEIVRIFNRAYKIIVKNSIPSFREGGKVNTTRANNWERLDGSGFDPSHPGGGPFRNKKLHMAWNDSVLKVMKNNNEILKNARIVDDNGKPVKAQYPITKFMTDCLDDSKMFYKGHQAKYLSQHFGLKVSDADENKPENPFRSVDKDNTKKSEVESAQRKIVKISDNLRFESSVGNFKKYGIYRLNMSVNISGKAQTMKFFMVGLGEYGDHNLYKISLSDKIIDKYIEGYSITNDKNYPIYNIFIKKDTNTASSISFGTKAINKKVIPANTEPQNLTKAETKTLSINSMSVIMILKNNGDDAIANNRTDVNVFGNITLSNNDNNKLYTILEGTNENIITFNNFKNII